MVFLTSNCDGFTAGAGGGWNGKRSNVEQVGSYVRYVLSDNTKKTHQLVFKSNDSESLQDKMKGYTTYKHVVASTMIVYKYEAS